MYPQTTTHQLNTHMIHDARAEALFVSPLQPSERFSVESVRAAIATSIRTYGSRGCAARVAEEFGDHPETAVRRMLWARTAVELLTNPPAAAQATAARPAPLPVAA